MKKFLLSLSVAMLSVVGAWAQEMSAGTADPDGASVRRLEVTLSGDWLNGAKVDEMTTQLIDLVMGYVATPKLDGEGNPIYVQAVDGEGNPVVDSEGKPVYVQDVDENGNPLVDADNKPVYVQEYNDPAFHPEKAFTEVTIKSASGTVTINNRLFQQLLSGKVTELNGQFTWHTANNKITRLDLSEVAVTGYVGNPDSNNYADGAACPGGESPIVYFAMPSFDTTVANQAYTIPSYVFNGLNSLDELILPANTVKVGTAAFAGLNYNKFKLNVGLKFIGNAAFYAASDRKGMGVLDVPSTVEYIGPEAFWFRSFTDIYFHSAQAPICPIGKGAVSGADRPMLYEDCYMGNNGFSDTRENAEKQSPTKPGKANRENYYSNGGRWMVMIHFPSSAEMEAQGKTLDIASYKDATRVYNKVYGTIYYNDPTRSDYDAGKVEIAIPGHEQEYIARHKIWGEQGSYDYVGKEASALTYKGLTAVKDVNSGFEDTYRGLNYIWPSQSQWVRAYTTVALGYNWDGVTKYRPELTSDQIAYMIEDNLMVDKNQDGTGNWVAVGQDITYDEAMANAYNATLPGAVKEGDAKETWTAEDAIVNNAELDGAVEAGDSKGEYTADEAIAYNAELDGAVKAGDTKETWTAEDAITYNADLTGAWHEGEDIYYTAEEVIAYNATLDGSVKEGDPYDAVNPVYYSWDEYKGMYPSEIENWMNETWYWEQYVPNSGWNQGKVIKTPGKPAGNYTASEAAAYNEKLPGAVHITTIRLENITADIANAHNAELDGAVKAGDTKTVFNAEEAIAYNADLDGAVKAGDSKGTYSADEAIAYNAGLEGAVKEGDVKERWTAADAIAYNAELTGARAAGFTSKNYDDPAIAELLSIVAFQSTRRCVFGANDGGGNNYDPKIPSSEAWWTICLPFNLTKAQIDKYFGEGTHVCLFNQVDRNTAPTEGQKPYIKLYFTKDVYAEATSGDDIVLKAHVPYMIYPTISDDDAVYLKNGIPGDEVYKETGNPIPTIVTAEDGAKYRFIGNYDTKLPVSKEDGTVENIDVVVPQYSYIYAKKANATGKHPYQFWFTQSAKIKWGPNKCIVQSTEADRGLTDQNTFFAQEVQAAKGQTQQITILGDEADDSEATAIDVIIVAGNGEDSQVIYNLNGQKLNAVPQNGVYIKNGKKYIAK